MTSAFFRDHMRSIACGRMIALDAASPIPFSHLDLTARKELDEAGVVNYEHRKAELLANFVQAELARDALARFIYEDATGEQP